MRLGELEQILDSTVSRGIGNSGLTSRAIQQANIESLHGLSGAINDSRSERENLQATRTTNIGSQYLKSLASLNGNRGSKGGAGGFNLKSLSKPLVVGRNPATGSASPNETTVLMPAGDGRYVLRTVGDTAMKANANNFEMVQNAPVFGTNFVGGDPMSLEDIKRQIYNALSSAESLGISSHPGGGFGVKNSNFTLQDLLQGE